MKLKFANDVVLKKKKEAKLVLARMIDIIDKYDVVSVADFYDLVGLESERNDNRYGWTKLYDAKIRKVDNGYLIKFPVLEEI